MSTLADPMSNTTTPSDSGSNPSVERLYRVWACDNQVYGPIPLSILSDWIHDSRVFRDTWVYVEDKLEWCQAVRITELRNCFPDGGETIFLQREVAEQRGIDMDELRLFPVFSGLSNRELAQLVRFADLI